MPVPDYKTYCAMLDRARAGRGLLGLRQLQLLPQGLGGVHGGELHLGHLPRGEIAGGDVA